MQHAQDLDLTIIVVCRDDEERVGHQVRRLAAHVRDLHLRAEILAIDEFSGDNTLTLLSLLRRDVPELRVVAGVMPGRGYVRGAQIARGRALLLVDARCDAPLAPIGFALGRLLEGFDAAAVNGRFLLLRRARVLDAFDALSHRRDAHELERRFLRRARALNLRVERAGVTRRPQTTWRRVRDTILVPLASRAW